MASTSARGLGRVPPDGTPATPYASPLAPLPDEASLRRAPIPEGVHHTLLPILSALVAVPSVFWWIMQSASFIKEPGGFDFCIYFAAALALHDNPHANILDLHVIQAAALRHHAPSPVMSYVYPPLVAVALLPLTSWHYVDAARLWVALNLVLWVLATFLLAGLLAFAFTGARTSLRDRTALVRQAGLAAWLRNVLTSRRPSAVAVFALGTAVFASLGHEPAAKGVALGQVSILIFFLLVLAPWFLLKGQPELAGVTLALATTIKIFPILLIGYYLMRGRWRVLLGAAGAFALLFWLMGHVVGLQGLLATRAIFSVGAQLGFAANNQALAHLPMWIAVELGRVPGPKTMRLGYALIAIVALIFALGMIATAWRDLRMRCATSPEQAANSHHDLLGYAWTICTMILVSPIVWEHYGSWLLPACAICLGYAAQRLTESSPHRKGGASRWQAVFAVIAVIIAYALTSRLFPFNYDSEVTLSPGPYLGHIAVRPLFMVLRPFGTTMLWLALGWLFLRPNLHTEHSHEAPAEVDLPAEGRQPDTPRRAHWLSTQRGW